MPSGIWYTSLKPPKVPSHQDGRTPVVFCCTSHCHYYKGSLATLIPETHWLLMPRCPSHITEFLLLNHPPNNFRRVKQNKCFLHLLFHYSPKLSSLYVLSKDSSRTLQPTLFFILFPLALKLREESINYSHPTCRHSPLESKFLKSLPEQSFNHDYCDQHADGVLMPWPLLRLSGGHMPKTPSFFPESHWYMHHWEYW